MDIGTLIKNHLQGKPFVIQPKTERKTREHSDSIDWKTIDYAVFKAALHFSFAGADINKFILSCPTFVRKNDAKNRDLIGRSLVSLQERGLVKVTGQGRDRYIQAANGASLISYFPRGELPPVAVVYRRTTVKEETLPKMQNDSESDSDSEDYDDLLEDLSVE